MSENNQASILGESLRNLVKESRMLEKNELTCCGILLSQYNAILEIGKVGKMNLNELSDVLFLYKSTLSKTVDNLVDNQWVTREENPEDRRYISIRLTEKGSKAYAKIQEMLEAYYQKIYEAIPENNRAQVIESVEVLLNAFRSNKCCK
jgi:DNA-binding MarR family transcriptional regulator